MTITLPQVIHAYFTADRSSDLAAFLRCFTDAAVVTDEGHTHAGKAAIERWKTGTAAQFSYTVEPFAIADDGDHTTVTSHLVGNFPGSPVDLRYVFRLEGDRIAALEIVP